MCLENGFVFWEFHAETNRTIVWLTLWLYSLNWPYKIKNLAFCFTSMKERRIIILHYVKNMYTCRKCSTFRCIYRMSVVICHWENWPEQTWLLFAVQWLSFISCFVDTLNLCLNFTQNSLLCAELNNFRQVLKGSANITLKLVIYKRQETCPKQLHNFLFYRHSWHSPCQAAILHG